MTYDEWMKLVKPKLDEIDSRQKSVYFFQNILG